ncbi:MAG: hypothetical protein ACSLFN_13280 [Candidatus Limnocylindrales bacterium]
MSDVRAYLEGQDHGTLVEMILAQTDHDDRLRERLLLRTTMAATAGVDAGQIRRAIDRAVRVGDFVEYAGAYDYARGIHDATDLVEALLRDGQPLVVIELCEHALHTVERAIESVDDSDGEMGGLLERLQELHLAACRAARPDPEELAARLFAWGGFVLRAASSEPLRGRTKSHRRTSVSHGLTLCPTHLGPR